jgi:hypothetical protein
LREEVVRMMARVRAPTLCLAAENDKATGLNCATSLAMLRRMREQGWMAMAGQMIDASIVPLPKPRDGRGERRNQDRA